MLFEEGAPVDSEARREAEVIRQVRESEPQPSSTNHTNTSSPNLEPTQFGLEDSLEDIPEDEMINAEVQARRKSSSFTKQAMKNSGGVDFWNNFDDRMRTPPPPPFPRGSSSGISDDLYMETPASSVYSSSTTRNDSTKSHYFSSRSRSSTPQPPSQPAPSEMSRKMKRRRDDDFDPVSFKRRAVSPGMSLQNSPVLPQSPSTLWGNPQKQPSGHGPGERVGSTSSGTSVAGSVKRVGLQGMTDTHDGLMNMSIE